MALKVSDWLCVQEGLGDQVDVLTKYLDVITDEGFSSSSLLQDLDDIEDENEQLKQENKTLLKVVGQLTR